MYKDLIKDSQRYFFHRVYKHGSDVTFDCPTEKKGLRALSTYSTGQLHVLWHDRHSLGVDGTQVGVLEQTHEIGLTRFLQSHHRGALKSEISFEVLSHLTDKSLERKLTNEQFG